MHFLIVYYWVKIVYMELLVTLRNDKYIDKIKTVCDGIIVGTLFTSGYSCSTDDLIKVKEFCRENRLKLYIQMENFISEDETKLAFDYLDFLNKLDVDGIYYHDLGVYEIASSLGMIGKLIYDGYTVLCNSLDVAYHASTGINGVKISNELTLDEVANILTNNPQVCDMQIFGHLRMSYSKRNFLKNYFKEINKEYDYFKRNTLYLVEEQRDYKMPIVEDESGTKIYTDYIFEMYRELSIVKPYLKRGIVDTLFIDDDRIVQVLRDYKHITNDNSKFLFDSLKANYPGSYASGYLYEKTNITKDE